MTMSIILVMILLIAGFGYYMLRNLAEDFESRGLRYVAEVYLFMCIAVFAVLFLWADGFSVFG